MAKPFFSNNPSDWVALEGMYVNELVPPAAVLGVNLNGVAIVGTTLRGPVNTPVQISSPQRFVDVFGGRDLGDGVFANNVWLAMQNKAFGPNTEVIRAAAAAAVTATRNTSDGYLTVAASSPGAWGNAVTFQVKAATDANVNHFDLTITDYDGRQSTYHNLDISGSNNNLLAAVGDDAANPVVLTKVSPGRPVNQGPTALATGADGSVADSDYTAANGPLESAAALDGVGCVFVAEHSSAAIKTKMATLSAASSDRVFLVCADTASTSLASAITDVAGLSRSDRMIYCFNHPWTLDNKTAVQVQTQPTSWMASILSQTDVSVNPGSAMDTNALLAGISKLTNAALQRADYISARVAGIAALERYNGEYDFASGVSTYLADGTGKEQIDRRRETDFIQISLANALNAFVKQKRTIARRKQIVAEITSFCRSIQGTIIAPDDQTAGPGFSVDENSLNTANSVGQGLEIVVLKVRLLNDMDYIVLQTTIGTEVSA